MSLMRVTKSCWVFSGTCLLAKGIEILPVPLVRFLLSLMLPRSDLDPPLEQFRLRALIPA